MSRTLSGIRQLEADQIAKVLQQITQPVLDEEVMQALKRSGRLVYAGPFLFKTNGWFSYLYRLLKMLFFDVLSTLLADCTKFTLRIDAARFGKASQWADGEAAA